MQIETMATQLISTSKVPQSYLVADRDTAQVESKDVLSSYDGSNVVFRLMRMETWGPALLNLGYYPFSGPLGVLNLFANCEQAQRRLVMKSLELLEVGR